MTTTPLARRTLCAGLAVLAASSCTTAPRASQPAPSRPTSTTPSESTEQGPFTLHEVIDPVRIALRWDGADQPLTVRLLGLADIKAEGDTATAFAPRDAIEAAVTTLHDLLTDRQIYLTTDQAAPDADADATLLRYVWAIQDDDTRRDVAVPLIRQGAAVYDPDPEWADLEQRQSYINYTALTSSDLWTVPDGGDPSDPTQIRVSR